jgi:hypothetical protein
MTTENLPFPDAAGICTFELPEPLVVDCNKVLRKGTMLTLTTHVDGNREIAYEAEIHEESLLNRIVVATTASVLMFFALLMLNIWLGAQGLFSTHTAGLLTILGTISTFSMLMKVKRFK